MPPHDSNPSSIKEIVVENNNFLLRDLEYHVSLDGHVYEN